MFKAQKGRQKFIKKSFFLLPREKVLLYSTVLQYCTTNDPIAPQDHGEKMTDLNPGPLPLSYKNLCAPKNIYPYRTDRTPRRPKLRHLSPPALSAVIQTHR